jgi:hypothetical protein|uniref:NADH-ubiquinone oxidoreductase 21kDa subunit N-terminal domain-containing protein n=2 Tax=Picea TaxID=3328 RepID=A9NJY0_PICSI|nr:unknown [Picea sitchensis]
MNLNTETLGMLAKPEYPVIDKNPPFTKAVANFSFLDYLRMTTITSASVPFGYLAGGNCSLRGPSMVTAGIIGLMGGFMFAYQNSAGRLMGLFPNEEDVARYKKKGKSF